ncbi:MAG: ComF family protein [Clostridiales bacterium]|nr:ComF family protein [Clostridiales bacterium]
MISHLLDWIYPRRCVFCDDLLGKNEKYLCRECRKKVPVPIREPRCKKCGKPLNRAEQEYCRDCRRGDQMYDGGMGIFLYKDPLKQSLMRFKFHGRKEYGEFLGKLMCTYSTEFISRIRPEVILPVPLHKKKQNARGYNQAQILAEEVSRGFSIPIRTDLVLRKKFTKAQKELNRKERKKNLEQAFTVEGQAGQYQRVLVVDDIYTTGSTVNAIAGKLKKQGVKEVWFLTLCIGEGL